MKKDVKTKEFLQNPECFADAFNYYLFDGDQVISGSSLEEKDAEEIVFAGRPKQGAAYKRERDLLRGCIVKSDGKATYVLLGIENQSDLHYAMPVRNLLYDALNYAGQVKRVADAHDRKGDVSSGSVFLSGFTREDRIVPVITLVIYWGDREWDAPRSLSEMFADMDGRIKDYVSDYRINLIIPHDIEDFGRFHSELGEVLEIIKRQREENLPKKLMAEKGDGWTMSRSAVELIGEFVETKLTSGKKKGGKIEMKNAFQLLEEKGIEKGIDRHLVTLVVKKLAKGKPAEVIADEVEEDVGYVSDICRIASEFAPDYNVDDILKKLKK